MNQAFPPDFRVVVPMFNEEAGAEKAVLAIRTALAPFGARAALIVVDDGSTDGTRPILRRLAADMPDLRFVERETNGGYGAAVRTGAERAAAEGAMYALFMDSDLTNDPADIPRFAVLMEGGADVIKATRFRRGGRMEGVPLRRALLSRLANLVASVLFGVGLSDPTNGFRAVRTSLLSRIRTTERGFASIVEELWWAKALGASFAELPVVLRSRSGDQRPTAFAYRPAVFRAYLRYSFRAFRRLSPS